MVSRHALVAAVALLLPLHPASAAGTIDPVVQVVADVTLIDAQCRSENAAFDTVFNYAKDKNVAIVDIMPLGKRRTEFDSAYHRRLSRLSHEEICGSLKAEYEQMFPGLFTTR